MDGDMNTQVDVQTEIARLWSAVALVHARLEVPYVGRGPGRALWVSELNKLVDDARVATLAADAVLVAYGRLYRSARAVSGGLHRECDHATYHGSRDAVDDLAAELEDARMQFGAGLLAGDDNEGGVHHG